MTAPSETGLLPCRCGSENLVMHHDRQEDGLVHSGVLCRNCYATSGWHDSDAQAAEAWNAMRAPSGAAPAAAGPWKIGADKPNCIMDEHGAVICTVSPECAAQIVREHNSHAALLAEVERLTKERDAAQEALDVIGAPDEMDLVPMSDAAIRGWAYAAANVARAALEQGRP